MTAMTPARTAPDKLHIGFVQASLDAGGAARVTLSLADSLLRRGHRVDLLLGRFIVAYRDNLPGGMRLYYPRLPNVDRELLRCLRQRGIPAQPMTINPAMAGRDWLALRRKGLGISIRPKLAVFGHIIARYIRRQRPQLLVSALQGADEATGYAAELTGRSVHRVVTVHNNITLDYSEAELRAARALFPRASALVGVSRGVAAEAQRALEIPAGRVRAIYNPIPSGQIWRLAQEPVTHPWFCEGGGTPVILALGREAPAKDHSTLVAAFGLARRQLPARLVIMGRFSESCRAGLIAQARGCGVAGDLEFVDFDANPYRYMRRAGLLALSSRWEGLPTVLLEALACGAPVVSTDTPYGPREILADGKYGKLTPVGDAPALARAIVETLQGDRPPSAALRRRAAAFSPRRAADAYVALFEQVVSQNDAPAR